MSAKASGRVIAGPVAAQDSNGKSARRQRDVDVTKCSLSARFWWHTAGITLYCGDRSGRKGVNSLHACPFRSPDFGGRNRINRRTSQLSVKVAAGRQGFAEQRFGHAWTASKFDVSRARRLRELLGSRPPGPVLDVGCWDGAFLAQVLGDAAAVGVDVSHAALREAARRSVRPVRGQLETGLPFRAAAFSTVVAAEIIEHVFDTQAAIDELARVLQPGGWLVITTPNLVALSGRAQLLLGRSPHNVEFDASPSTSGHIRYFTFDTLELLLRRAGLEPLGRWTNVAHFSVLGSSEIVGRFFPGLGHALISIARK